MLMAFGSYNRISERLKLARISRGHFIPPSDLNRTNFKDRADLTGLVQSNFGTLWRLYQPWPPPPVADVLFMNNTFPMCNHNFHYRNLCELLLVFLLCICGVESPLWSAFQVAEDRSLILTDTSRLKKPPGWINQFHLVHHMSLFLIILVCWIL